MTLNPGGTGERTMIARALAGDDDAFAALVHIHKTTVYNIAYRLIGQREIAQDLAQETFLRAFKALDTFDPCRPLMGGFDKSEKTIKTKEKSNELAQRTSELLSDPVIFTITGLMY